MTPPPVPQPGEPVPPVESSRDRGDGSYVEIAKHMKALEVAINGLSAYMPSNAAITGAALTTLATDLNTNNEAVDTADTNLDKAQRKRFNMYFAKDTGLHDRFIGIKDAVKSQYGQDSTEYAEVKGVRW